MKKFRDNIQQSNELQQTLGAITHNVRPAIKLQGIKLKSTYKPNPKASKIPRHILGRVKYHRCRYTEVKLQDAKLKLEVEIKGTSNLKNPHLKASKTTAHSHMTSITYTSP